MYIVTCKWHKGTLAKNFNILLNPQIVSRQHETYKNNVGY